MDIDRSETLDRIARKLASASASVLNARLEGNAQKSLGMAHMIASSALEELDKLVIKDSLTTPMFGGL
jgi:hypothetical protein